MRSAARYVSLPVLVMISMNLHDDDQQAVFGTEGQRDTARDMSLLFPSGVNGGRLT